MSPSASNHSYVFNNVHNIQPGVPPANITALFDTTYDAAFYK